MDNKKLLESFRNIPRDKEVRNVQESEQYGKERTAIRNLKQLLSMVEKRMLGNMTEAEEQSLKERREEWTEDIAVLREYISKTEDK